MPAYFRASIKRSGAILGDRIERADTFVRRAVGLLGRSSLEPGQGLILPGTNQVHMFGMRFPIDLVFISAEGGVLFVERALRPWRISPKIFRASSVVELPSGVIDQHGIQVGDVIELTEGAP